jgi:hypothetical protein
MNPQHLSDEAVAAFADGVLRGLARERATRHVNACAECRRAVQVQREAAWALRAATTPPPPSALLERLRTVPQTTPIQTLPTAVAPDGTTMIATFAAAPMAALVPQTGQRKSRHVRPFVAAAAALAAAGSLAAGSVASGGSPAAGHAAQPVTSRSGPQPTMVDPALFVRLERP